MLLSCTLIFHKTEISGWFNIEGFSVTIDMTNRLTILTLNLLH